VADTLPMPSTRTPTIRRYPLRYRFLDLRREAVHRNIMLWSG
jgi:aspartyl-tRNA synthetase